MDGLGEVIDCFCRLFGDLAYFDEEYRHGEICGVAA